MEQATKEHGKPEMINTDQGSQFTATEFTEYVLGEGITFSMDGKGRAIDNLFIEQFWHNIKYEKLYLEPSEDGMELYEKIKDYMKFYNTQRPHQSLAYKMPATAFRQAA